MKKTAAIFGAIVALMWLGGSALFAVKGQALGAVVFLIAATTRALNAWAITKDVPGALRSAWRSGLFVMGICALNFFTDTPLVLIYYSIALFVVQGIAAYAAWRVEHDAELG